MNRQQAKELLPIIQAFAEGKIIQSRRINGRWIDLDIKAPLSITSVIEEPQKISYQARTQIPPIQICRRVLAGNEKA